MFYTFIVQGLWKRPFTSHASAAAVGGSGNQFSGRLIAAAATGFSGEGSARLFPEIVTFSDDVSHRLFNWVVARQYLQQLNACQDVFLKMLKIGIIIIISQDVFIQELDLYKKHFIDSSSTVNESFVRVRYVIKSFAPRNHENR